MTHVSRDGDDVECRSVTSKMLCSTPIFVDADPYPVFNFPSLSKHDVDPSSCRDLSNGRLYSPDSIVVDCRTMSDASAFCISEEPSFDVDDRRFSERLASFRDDSFDNDENKLPSRTTERQHSATHHANCRVSQNATRKSSPVIGGGLVNTVVKPVRDSENLKDGQYLPATISSAVIWQLREQPNLTVSAELPVSDRSTIGERSSFSQSIITNGQSPSAGTRSSPVCHKREDNVTLVMSESKVSENRLSEETTGRTNIRMDVVGESENPHDSSSDTTSRKLSNDTDKMDDIEDNEDYFSCDDNIETDRDIVTLKGYSHQLCSVVEKSDSDESKYEIFDSSTSIYDRIDKYNGVANRRRQINCTDKLPIQGLRVPLYHIAKQQSNGSVQLEMSMASEKRLNSLDVSVHVDSTALLLSANSVTNQPHNSHPDEASGVTECAKTDAGSFPHFQSNQCFAIENRHFDVMNRNNRTTENRDSGAEQGIVIGANSNCKQNNSNAAAASAMSSLTESRSSKDNIDSRNDSSAFTTPSDNGEPMLACMASSADGDCYWFSFPQSVDKQMQLASNEPSDARRVAKTQRNDWLPEDLSRLHGFLTNSSCDENKRRPTDTTKQLTTANSSVEVVSSDPSFSGLRLSDVDVRGHRPSSSAAQNSSLMEIDTDVGRPSLPSADRDKHRRRLEAMKKQLLNAKPVAPPSSSIDSVWNSRIARKLTPAARSRSAVWAPYDAFCSNDTRTRPSTIDDRIWRTTSLQTLSGKSSSAGVCHRSSGSTTDLGSQPNDAGIREGCQQTEMSFDKSRSLFDLRRVPDGESQLQASEIGSVDDGLNTEDKIALFSSSSSSSSAAAAAAPLRPLPSEVFIRQSLERLNLPDWYLNSSSSLLRKKVVGADHKHGNASTSGTPSCSAIDVGKTETADWKSPTEAISHVTSHQPSTLRVSSSLVTSSDVATSSKVPDSTTAYRFDTTKCLHPTVDRHTLAHRKSTRHATELSSTEFQPTGVHPEDFRNSQHRHKRRATKTDETEQYRCPHGKKNWKKCSQCRRQVLDTAPLPSPSRCQTKPNERTSYRSPPVETTPVMSSVVFQEPTTEAGDNVFSYSTPVQSTVNHKTDKQRQKPSTQHKKRAPAENDENKAALTPGCNVMDNRSLYCQEAAVTGGTVDESGQYELSSVSSSLERRKTPSISEVRPRSIRLRKVKSRASSEDVRDHVGKEHPSKSSRDKLLTDSASRENGGSPYSRNRTEENVTVVASTTSDALEIHKSINDIPAAVSNQSVVVEDDGRMERKVQRRRRRQQRDCANISFQATVGEGRNDILIANGNNSSDYLLTQRSNERDHNNAVDVKPTKSEVELEQIVREFDGGEQGEAVTGDVEGRRRRRRTASSEAPPSECMQNEQKYHGRHTADLNDRPISPSRRRRCRRLRVDPSSRLNVEDADYLPVQMLTSNSERKSSVQYRSQNQQSASVCPGLSVDSSQRCGSLEYTTKLFEVSYSALTEGDCKTTSSCRPDDATLSISHRHHEHPRRRSRHFPATGSSSFPVDSSTPEVINTQPQLEQDDTRLESTSYRPESSSTEQKPCLSAAARRCRRVKVRRSRYLHDQILRWSQKSATS